jgi:dihydrofolate reductase
MRKVTYTAACSLDGYMATADHGIDWRQWSTDVQRLTAACWERVDTVLMGKRSA